MHQPRAVTFCAIAALGAAACAQVLSLDDYVVRPIDSAVDAGTEGTREAGDDQDGAPLPDSASDSASDRASDSAAEGGPDGATPAEAGAEAGADSGGDAGDAGPDGSPAVRLRILSPAQNGIANVGANNLATVLIETTNYTIRPSGQCAGAANCGHAHVTIAGADCNDVAGGKAYNVQITGPGPAAVNMGFCQAGALGVKTVSVELMADNHRPLPTREIATATANFVRGKVRLTSPLDEAVLAVPASKLIPVRFLVSDFTLRAPGQCTGLPDCGHARVTVGATTCNAAGHPYNAIATSTAGTTIDLAHCGAEYLGTKTVKIELVDDNGAPLAASEAHAVDVTFVP